MTTNDLVAVVSLLHASAFCRGTDGPVANARLASSCSFYSRQSGDAKVGWLLPCAVYPRHHQVHLRGRKGDLTTESLPYKGSSQSGAEESQRAPEDPYGQGTERGAMLAPRAGLSRIVSACARTLTSSPRALQQHAEATAGYNGYASSFGPFQYEGAPSPSLFSLLS